MTIFVVLQDEWNFFRIQRPRDSFLVLLLGVSFFRIDVLVHNVIPLIEGSVSDGHSLITCLAMLIFPRNFQDVGANLAWNQGESS